MGMINRLRRGMAALRSSSQRNTADAGTGEALSFTAALPVAGSASPLWQLDLSVSSEPHADGERLRLRARVQTNFASALRPAVARSGPAALGGAKKESLSERTGALVQRTASRMLAVPGVRSLAEPLLRHDFNTWLEVQTSTASLDTGPAELLPQSERLTALGIRPKAAGSQPVAETWSGEVADGMAQVSVLQLDKRHLPPRLQQSLGDKPFALAATIVNTVQQKS